MQYTQTYTAALTEARVSARAGKCIRALRERRAIFMSAPKYGWLAYTLARRIHTHYSAPALRQHFVCAAPKMRMYN